MNCNLTNKERENGNRCRSWGCNSCKDFGLSVNDASIINIHMHNMELKKQNLDLQSKLDKAIEALKFYASPSGSYVSRYKTYTRYRYDSEVHEDAGYKLVLVGKRARAILKELGVE